MNLTKEFWEKAYIENAPKMKGVCRRYVSDNAIAEDLMHDAFLTAINKYYSYTGKGSFEAWLRKISVNTALMYLRDKNSKKLKEDLMQNENQFMEEANIDNIRGVIEQADFSDRDLLETIDKLPEHHKLVFNLHVIDNFTHVQIGKELNISAGTSKSHLARARKKIQQLLYEKALEKPQEQKKKKSAAILFILSYQSNYIDKLYKGKLLNYVAEPVSNSSSFIDSVNWGMVPLRVINPGIFNLTFNSWFIGTTCGIIIIFSSIFIGKNYMKSPVVPVLDTFSPDHFKTNMVPVDTTVTKTETDTISKKNNPDKGSQKFQPVVIRKTIIHRKTITIRDTVKIIDSTNVH